MENVWMAIKKDIEVFTEVIAQMLDLDVFIVDKSFNIVGVANKYQIVYDGHPYLMDSNNSLTHTYLLRNAIDSGTVTVITDPKSSIVCDLCDKKDNCKILFQISAPIYLNGEMFGALSLSGYNEEQQQFAISNQDAIIRFVNFMVDIVVSKASSISENNENLQIINMLKYSMNKIEDGILIFDKSLHGVAINESGKRILNIQNNILKNSFSLEDTGERLLQFNKYVLSYDEGVYEIAGKLFNVNAKDWDSVLIFKDYHHLLQSVMPPIHLGDNKGLSRIIGESPQMLELKKRIKTISDSFSNVLMIGESGTGKEVIAKAIHEESRRSGNVFLGINCSAIPEHLLESELFGYAKGAFTGANAGGKIGKIEYANNGTLFLDEIGDMPLNMQAKLLRVLEEREIVRVGDYNPIKVNVRVIAATHKNLQKMIEEKTFREDLYYRLNVIPLFIPPLRERSGEIPILATFFLEEFAKLFDKKILGIDAQFIEILSGHTWPGNVRELKNMMEYIINILDSPGRITGDMLKERLSLESANNKSQNFNLEEMENRLIIQAMEYFEPMGYSREEIARELGIGAASLYRKLNKIDKIN